MRQYDAGERRADYRIYHVARRDLDHTRNTVDDFCLRDLRSDREIKSSVFQQPFVLDPADIQGFARLFERDRHAAARYYGFEKVTELGQETDKCKMEVVVVVFYDVFRMVFERKSHKPPDQHGQLQIKFLRMQQR